MFLDTLVVLDFVDVFFKLRISANVLARNPQVLGNGIDLDRRIFEDDVIVHEHRIIIEIVLRYHVVLIVIVVGNVLRMVS